ncbi:MAG: hypothetical protein D6712_19470 [Chloroflexi bacterium]|nr:MAG: hypothetical protein D6712_19470 [Chloroflexota bacterium]
MKLSEAEVNAFKEIVADVAPGRIRGRFRGTAKPPTALTLGLPLARISENAARVALQAKQHARPEMLELAMTSIHRKNGVTLSWIGRKILETDINLANNRAALIKAIKEKALERGLNINEAKLEKTADKVIEMAKQKPELIMSKKMKGPSFKM